MQGGRTATFPHTPRPPSALSERRANARRNHSGEGILGEESSNIIQKFQPQKFSIV